jgi:hypothetical protein
VAWAEIESERTYEAREEAIRGTEAEQNADTALVEVEGVVSAEWDRYLTDSYFIGGPEPEAGS